MYIKRVKVLSVLFIMGVLLLGCSNQEEKEVNSPEITLQEFNQLSKGMSYEEVAEIIGSDGIQSAPDDDSTKMLIWDGVVKGSFASIEFKKNQLTRKMQVDLK